MLLLLDNFDSFTYNLYDYIGQLGTPCIVRRNNVDLDEIKSLDVSKLVISPGTGIPYKSGNLMKIIDHYHDRIPILGICLGHQAIGQYFGADLVKAKEPKHGKLSSIEIQRDCIFTNVPKKINVVRYNSLILNLKGIDDLIPLAVSDNGELMALRHKNLPIWGLQYHPEAALTEYGLTVLKNWLVCKRIL